MSNTTLSQQIKEVDTAVANGKTPELTFPRFKFVGSMAVNMADKLREKAEAEEQEMANLKNMSREEKSEMFDRLEAEANKAIENNNLKLAMELTDKMTKLNRLFFNRTGN